MTYENRYVSPPPLPRGYPLATNPFLDVLSIVIPEATTNLIINPSFETNTTSYSAVAGTLTRDTTEQAFGACSAKLVPTSSTTDGLFYSTGVVLTSGTSYTFSVYVLGVQNVPYKIYFATTGGVQLGSATTFRGRGVWQRVSVMYQSTANQTARLYLTKNGSATTRAFYSDAWQVEAKTYATTYCDGDQIGYVSTRQDFFWSGAAHASTSSRIIQCRAGGRIMNLRKYGLTLLAFLGLGMGPVIVEDQTYAQIGGGVYHDSIPAIRPFTLVADLRGETYYSWQSKRRDLIDAIKPDLTDVAQPMTLLYQAQDECGDPLGEEVRIPCVYTGGLEGSYDNRHGETMTMTFKTYIPYIVGLEEGANTGYTASLANANYIVKRSALGTWSVFGSGPNDIVSAIARAPDGAYYVGGNFTLAGGVANTARIAKWDGSAWSALGTGANGSVVALAVAADGTLYAAGAFTLMGGIANTNRIAKWNGAAWSALGTGANDTVRDIVIGSDGTLYATGDFTLMGGVANTVRIAKWDGSVWTPLGTGLSGAGQELFIGSDGDLYVGGSFVTANGVTVNGIAKWNGTTFEALGSGTAGVVYALAQSPNGNIIAGGSFTSIGGVTAQNIASWNGTTWAAMGAGIGVTTPIVNDLRYDTTGLLYIGGGFTTAGPLTTPDGLARWSSGTYLFGDINLPGSSTVTSFLLEADGSFSIGFTTAGTATIPSVTTITNNGTAAVAPRFRITGPGDPAQIINYTTGKYIYFNNLQLVAGEVMFIDLDPQHIRFYSNIRSDLSSYVLPGSTLAGWTLLPGDNIVGVLLQGTPTGATEALISWGKNYWSLEGSLP